MPCRGHVRQLATWFAGGRDGAADVRMAVVGPGSTDSASALQARLNTPFPVLADPTGQSLDVLGLTRVLGLIRRSGTLAFDGGGVLRFAHRGAQPADALRLREAVAAVAPAEARG